MTATTRIFLAVSFGVIIGALIGLSLDSFFGRLPWINGILGAAFGGLISYLGYDVKAVFCAAQHTWKKTVGWQPSEFAPLKLTLAIKLALQALVSGVTMVTTILIPVYAIGAIAGNMKTAVEATGLYFCVGPMMMILYFFATMFTHCTNSKEAIKLIKSYKEARRMFSSGIKEINPVIVYGYYLPLLLYTLSLFAIKNALRIPGVALLPCRFARHLFIEIHSDARLICLVDAALFTAIAYCFASPIWILVSAICGGLAGALNYEYVSKRWLKLAPQQ